MMARSARNPEQSSIEDSAFISDGHTGALVSRDASIDWCCLPRFDSASMFGRLLDWERGGYCRIAPTGEFTAARSYVEGTLVLSTVFDTEGGEAEVLDCFTVHEGGARDPYRQLLRIVRGRRGLAELRVEVVPRLDYAEVKPWLRHHGPGVYSAIGGNDALVVSCDAPLAPATDHDLEATIVVRAGESVHLALQYVAPHEIDPSPPEPPAAAELDERLDETIRWWREWSSKVSLDGPYAPGATRSALVLKGLTHAPTGAVIAAPTTSLPEAIGAERNWDYRYSWIRDSHFTVRSLGQLGCHAEADGFRRFVERSAAASAESLQIMYGVGGERRLSELELDHLRGYRNSRPVRIGNGAARQLQLDVFGELLDLAWRWHERGSSPDDDYWRFLVSVVDVVADSWRRPDCGIWEIRGRPRHFVHSKAMCWVALDRGIRLAEDCLRQAPVDRWTRERDALRQAIETRGYDEGHNTFVQAFGTKQVDAALLLLPAFGVVAYDDPRMVGTTSAVADRLTDRGLIRRYRSADALDGTEGTFLACTFWLVDCWAHQGRLDDARALYDDALAAANDVGLFAEEFDAVARVALGNFPQALTHLSHVTAAIALSNKSTGARDLKAPTRTREGTGHD